MPPKKTPFKDAIAAAIDRVSTVKCSQDFSLKDLEVEYAAIAAATGSKSTKLSNAVNVNIQKLVKDGVIAKRGTGQFSVVGTSTTSALKTSAKAKKAAKVSGKAKTSGKGKAKTSGKGKAKTSGKGKAKTSGKGKAKKATTAAPSAMSTASTTVVQAKTSKVVRKPKKAPKAKTSAAKKKAASGLKRKRSDKPRRRSRAINFDTYAYKVLKQVTGGSSSQIGISKHGMEIISSMIGDTMHRLGTLALRLSQRVGRKTLSGSDIVAATRMLLTGELGKHAVSEGQKAVTSFDRKKTGSSTARAGLILSVPRTARLFRAMMPHTNISANAPVFAAAVVEYLLAEIFELSANAARDHKRHRIIPRHISLVIMNDAELDHFFKHATIARGGVIPDIKAELLPSKKARSE